MDTRVTSDGLRRDREWHPKVPEHGVNTSFSGSSEVSEQDNPHDEKGGIGAVPMIWMRGGVDFCQLCDSWEIPPTTMALPLSRCRSHVDMQTGSSYPRMSPPEREFRVPDQHQANKNQTLKIFSGQTLLTRRGVILTKAAI